MKRIIKFTVFKVLELSAAVLVWWGLSWYGYWIDAIIEPTVGETMLGKWLEAPFVGIMVGIFLPAVIVGIAILIIYGLIRLVQWNWKMAGES